MMSRILGNHPDIFSFQELHFFDELLPPQTPETAIDAASAIKLYATLMAIQRNGYFGSRDTKPFLEEASARITENKPQVMMDVYSLFLTAETKHQRKNIPCEQTPQNVFAIDSILKHLPDSRILVMVRDPRAVLFSQKYKWKRRELSGGKIPFWEMVRSRVNYHPVTISRIWKSVMTNASLYQTNPRVMFVKYEDLIADAGKTVRRICQFCNIEYHPSMTDIPVVGSSATADSGTQRGIDSGKAEQWRKGGLSETEIKICQDLNSAIMQDFGYEVMKVTPGALPVLIQKISFPFRLFAAAMLNLKRLRDPVKVFRKIFG